MNWKSRALKMAYPEPLPAPDFASGLPVCSDECPHHDGKRCELTGFRPDTHCEPVLFEMVSLLEEASE